MPPSTDTSQIQALRGRLDRLEQFLRADPDNGTLRADAFETALGCAEFERAKRHLDDGLAAGQDVWSWRLKEGDFWMAQKSYDKAQGVLSALRADPQAPEDLAPVVVHNLAFIDLQRGAFTDCVKRLASLMEDTGTLTHPLPPVLADALQSLWLRGLHRTAELERAMQWTQTLVDAGQLSPNAAGIASLIALDANDLQAAGAWSEFALTQGGEQAPPIEALATQASLKLGAGETAMSKHLAHAALQTHPTDGRCWSIVAFAELMDGNLAEAQPLFVKSLGYLPEHIGTWHGLGWTQILRTQIAQAQETFEKALEMDRNFAESHGGLAVTLAMQQRTEQAQEHIERALRLDRACLSAQYAQAIVNGETVDSERFARVAKRLLGARASGLGGTLLDKVEQRSAKS